ncbi:MAG: GNAT family N-acetyltransferase [Rhodospirillales bacterium]|nr:GNAT family N-acetyltransferase [Rhodospirillales bacterium]
MDDWSAWARLRNESRAFLQPWEPTWPRDALTQAAFRRRLRTQARDREQGIAQSFLIFRAEDDVLLGGVTLSDIRRGVAQAATLGYWIGERHARQGYMTEAVEPVIGHAFDGLDLHRLEAACLPTNEPSRCLLEARGFRMEGLAQSYLKIDGIWRDHLLFALVDTEWRERIARQKREAP